MTGLVLPVAALRVLLEQCVRDAQEQGVDVDAVAARAASVATVEEVLAVAHDLAQAPTVAGWPHVEPHALHDVLQECPDLPAARPPGPDLAARVRASWGARVAGCVLGKPFEFDPTRAELRGVLEPAGEWPLRDYVTEATNTRLRAPQPQWPECVRERITHVPEDDDLGYTALATVALERCRSTPDGPVQDALLSHALLRDLWLLNLPVAATFGPERTMLLAMGLATLVGGSEVALEGAALGTPGFRPEPWTAVLNPYAEHCGALIRTDAYGYARPGDPVGAARLAHVDATLTHRRTGVYAAMWVAAAVASALTADSWEQVALDAAAVVPARSRLRAVLDDAFTRVRAAGDADAAYDDLHGRYAMWTHCRVLQEVGTLLVTLRFARGADDGLGLQVGMGNDTDSFGATAGALLGALHGPAGFDAEHWLGRFGDRIHLALATTQDRSISSWGDRVVALATAPQP